MSSETSSFNWGELLTSFSNAYGAKTTADAQKYSAQAAQATAAAQTQANQTNSATLKLIGLGALALVGVVIAFKFLFGRK